MTTANHLPLVHQNNFKNAAKQYDNKEFKKALRSVEKILDSYPDHADSLALKGLLLKSIKPEDPEEAYRFIKLALKYSENKSFMAWNVYGSMKKEDCDFETAQNCFSNALKIDTTNLSVACDLAYTQAQMRNFKGLAQTRNLIVQMKPQYWYYWIGAIVANHLAKNYSVSLSLIDTFLKQYDSGAVNASNHAMSKYELSELLLYKVTILMEMSDHKQALKFLNIVEPFIKDRLSYLEYKSECLVKTGKLEESKKYYKDLLHLNCENYDYWGKLQQVSNLINVVDNVVVQTEIDEEMNVKLSLFYQEMNKEFPNASAVKRIPLNFLQGIEFENSFDQYVRPFLHSNVPSLFSNVKLLYKDQNKVQIIEKLMTCIASSLELNSFFPGTTQLEPPTTLLWTYLYLALHFDKIGQFVTALSYVEKAIEHTPTAIELYMCKARILKHCGNYIEAADQMDIARTMDLADRYLNTKATNYLNRADKTAQAEDVLYLFAKDQEGKFNAVDMQAMQYEVGTGYSFMRQGKYGKALKWFSHVVAHFVEIRNDQFDFHGYCLRKYGMRPYVNMLKYMDTLENQNYYYRTATGLVRTLLILHDQPELYNTAEGIEKNATESEVQTHLQDKKRYKKPASETPSPTSTQNDDPYGNKLLIKLRSEDNGTQTNLLNEADKYIKILIEFCSDRVDTHILAAEFYLKSERYLHALKSLKEAKKVDESHPSIHYYTCVLFSELEKGKVAESMSRLIKMQQNQLMQDFTDVNTFNNQYERSDFKRTLSHVKVGLQVLKLTDNGDEYAKLLVDSVSSHTKLSDLIEAYNLIKTMPNNESAENLKQKAVQIYPSCSQF